MEIIRSNHKFFQFKLLKLSSLLFIKRRDSKIMYSVFHNSCLSSELYKLTRSDKSQILCLCQIIRCVKSDSDLEFIRVILMQCNVIYTTSLESHY